MKEGRSLLLVSMAVIILTSSGVMAGEVSDPAKNQSSMQQGMQGMGMEKMDHSAHGKEMGAMSHSGRDGENIHNATVDGYQLAYHLIDMREQANAMKAEGHTHSIMTHHLMVYVNDPAGTPLSSAKTGFLVKAPNGSDQKVMGMAMGIGGYGANINFSEPGAYALTTKIIAGDKTIKDNFTYTAK